MTMMGRAMMERKRRVGKKAKKRRMKGIKVMLLKKKSIIRLDRVDKISELFIPSKI